MNTANNFVKSRRKYRNEYTRIISLWQESGKSRSEYCVEHNYNPSTFYGWIKKSRNQSGKLPSKLKSNISKDFVALEIDRDHFDHKLINLHTTLEVRYPNGVSLGLDTIPCEKDLSRIIHIYRTELCSR